NNDDSDDGNSDGNSDERQRQKKFAASTSQEFQEILYINTIEKPTKFKGPVYNTLQTRSWRYYHKIVTQLTRTVELEGDTTNKIMDGTAKK
ncbi:9960_t:CDS:2, partial [Dentiscutata erythropus]